MLKRIELEQNGKAPSEIVELVLDDCQSEGKFEGLNEEFSSLKSLSISNAKLTDLKGFPKLLKLQKLQMRDNDIEGGLSSLGGCVSLEQVDLSGNKIADIDVLSPLADLQHLTSLNLANCDVSKLPGYRENVHKLLPNLITLDGCKQTSNTEGQNGSGEVPNVEVSRDDDEEGTSGEESEEESGGEEYGLSYLERDDISDDEEDGDYEEEQEEEDAEIEEEDDEAARGTKRKLDEEDS